MSESNGVMKKVLALHDLLVAEKRRHGGSARITRLCNLMGSIKRVGIVDKTLLNGKAGRYFVIDGRSWQAACRGLKATVAPSFVMWEESEFLSFLQSQLSSRDNGNRKGLGTS